MSSGTTETTHSETDDPLRQLYICDIINSSSGKGPSLEENVNKCKRCNFHQRDNIAGVELVWVTLPSFCGSELYMFFIDGTLHGAQSVRYVTARNYVSLLHTTDLHVCTLFQAGPRAEAENSRKIVTNREVCHQESPSLPCRKPHSSSCSSTGSY